MAKKDKPNEQPATPAAENPPTAEASKPNGISRDGGAFETPPNPGKPHQPKTKSKYPE